MSSEVPRKLLSWLWVIPACALLAFGADRVFREHNPPPAPQREILKVPVEVIRGDAKPKVVYIELEAQSIPEPSSLVLIPFSCLFLVRRRR